MTEVAPQKNVVGIQPWLPWPLSNWRCWTEPVRAERLAMLRIGLSMCLLFDICYNYAPRMMLYFGQGGLGDPDIFDWRFHTPRTTWSLLRGFGDGSLIYLALTIWIATTLWILGNAAAQILRTRRERPIRDRTGVALVLWSVSFLCYIAGLAAQMLAAKEVSLLAWIMPLIAFSLACLFFSSEQLMRLLDSEHRVAIKSNMLSFAVPIVAFGFGFWLFMTFDPAAPAPRWGFILQSWQRDEVLLAIAFGIWIVSTAFLLFGCFTRVAAVATWLVSMSFANSNPYLDNAGDTIRLILLFYLMFCPSGAALSIDALFARRKGPVYVYPWPICLIIVQMIFLYFMNGLYKVFGPGWWAGNSLYYVLGDVALSRFSRVQLPISFEITRMLTWTTLAWEVSFPLLVLFKWSRRFALILGVMFHVGIGVTMELGGFVPYALCLYLPLFPWEWFRRDDSKQPVA
jgi:Vitamin K-dependent gamma-carboxylase